MTNALLWVLVLTTMLLFAAAMTAAGARSSLQWRRGLLHALSWLISSLLLTAALVFVGMHSHFFSVYGPYLQGTVALTVAFAVGLVAIRWYGRQRGGEGGASAWPTGRLLAATVISLALLVMTMWNLNLQSQIRLDGYRTKAAMVLLANAPPQVSDSLNAARVYERAFALMRHDETLKNSAALCSDSDAQSEEAQELLHRHAQTIELIRQAADMPECRFDFDYASPSITYLLPELPQQRRAADLLALAARREAAVGETDAGVRDLGRVYAVSRHVGESPILITHMVSMGTNGMAHQTLARLLPDVRSASQLNHLVLPDPLANVRRAKRALISESAFGTATIADAALGRMEGVFLPWVMRNHPFSYQGLPLLRIFAIDGDIEGYQRHLASASSLLDAPYYETTQQRSALEASKSSDSSPGVFTSILTPAVEGYLAAVTNAQALDEIAILAVAATRVRLSTGEYPTDTEQLRTTALEGTGIDPFDGKPIKMKLTDEGLIIYSVGRDLKDDGGVIDPQSRQCPADVGLILRTRPATPTTGTAE